MSKGKKCKSLKENSTHCSLPAIRKEVIRVQKVRREITGLGNSSVAHGGKKGDMSTRRAMETVRNGADCTLLSVPQETGRHFSLWGL